MSTDCQNYFGLRNPSDHIEKTHEFYTLYYLFQIFKELNPSYFNKNERYNYKNKIQALNNFHIR